MFHHSELLISFIRSTTQLFLCNIGHDCFYCELSIDSLHLFDGTDALVVYEPGALRPHSSAKNIAIPKFIDGLWVKILLAYLASDYVNQHKLTVDGGWMAR
jgi:hypothetical protein